MTDIPTVFPSSITAGDSLIFAISLDDYPAGEGWSLSYVLLNASSKITLESEADGDAHAFDISPDDTAEYTAADYKYTALVSSATARFSVDAGSVVIHPDPATLETYDGRTHAEICLENIEAVIQGKATADNYSYSIAGRQLAKYSWDDLISARNHYRQEVAKERRASAGKPQSRLLKMRFN